MFRAVRRGTLSQVADRDGRSVDVALYGCMVVVAPREKAGKVYVTLDLTACRGDVAALHAVDEFVRAQPSRPRFSPLAQQRLVVKVPGDGVAYETPDGRPVAPWPLLTNAVVDVVVRPGAFGAFGYCWLLRRVKPSAAVV